MGITEVKMDKKSTGWKQIFISSPHSQQLSPERNSQPGIIITLYSNKKYGICIRILFMDVFLFYRKND